MFNSSTHDNLVKNLKASQTELFTASLAAPTTASYSVVSQTSKRQTSAIRQVSARGPAGFHMIQNSQNAIKLNTRSNVVMLSSLGHSSKITGSSQMFKNAMVTTRKTNLNAKNLCNPVCAANKYEASSVQKVQDNKQERPQILFQDVAFEKFQKAQEGLQAATNQGLATLGKAALQSPFAQQLALTPKYVVNGDGSLNQTENHFDNVFKSIAIKPSGATSDIIMDEDDDEYDDEEDEEMPVPKEGKDIELGWDIDHMTDEDFKELKLRAQKLFLNDQRPVILFDGVCNFCNAYVNTIIDFDPEAQFRFASLQSKVGQALLVLEGKAPTDMSSIILAEKDTYYTKSEAVLRVAERLPQLNGYEKVASFGLVVPTFLRDSIYNWVSLNRYKLMGERDECRLAFEEEEEDMANRFIDDAAVMEVIEHDMAWESNRKHD